MRYTVQYIPLNKIKSGVAVSVTQRVKELRKAAQDCMHLLIVRKSKKDGGYVVVSGNHHLDYWKIHTKKKSAPCLVDQGKIASGIALFIHLLQMRRLPTDIPHRKKRRRSGGSLSIVRSFMMQEPRFRQLSRSQQIKVLRLGFQYKKTTIASMKRKVEELLG